MVRERRVLQGALVRSSGLKAVNGIGCNALELLDVHLQEASLIVVECLRCEHERATTDSFVDEFAPDHTVSIRHANELCLAVSKLEMLALLRHLELLLIIHLVVQIFPDTLRSG